ncbi:hypothetical protein D3C74_131800 [compost metagenome]
MTVVMQTNSDEDRAYVRVSTLKESQKDSPEHQEGLIRESAASDGREIKKVYFDRGTATTIIEREDVQEMIRDAKAGKFSTIWFASLSRFSRDTLDAISLKRILVNALGIRLVSIEDMYDSAKEDNEMIFTIISSVNQKQSETISTSSKRGIRQSAKKGNFTGSIAPFGYKKVVTGERKTLEIIPDEAQIVREMFDLYINKNMGEKSITNYLNDDKQLPSPKGGKWGLTTVQRILQNENYTGYLTFCKMESKKVYEDIENLQNRRKKLVQRDREKWERTEFQTHEAIISPELFQQACAIRELRGGGKRGGRKAYVNVFAKMIFCKECGSAMVTMGNERPSGKSYRYLMCSKRRRQGQAGCINATWIPYYDTRDKIIAGVIERLNKLVDLDNLSESTISNVEFSKRDFDKEIKALEKQLSDHRRLLFEVRKLKMLQELSDEQYEFERIEYENVIIETEKKLKRLTDKANEHRDEAQLKKDVKEALNLLVEIKDYSDVDRTRMTLLKLIEKIDVHITGEVEVYSVLGKL